MSAISSPAKAVLAAALMTFLQVALAVGLLAPAGAWKDRYTSLIQFDGNWFRQIVDYGYHTTVPPVDRQVMEISNVGFFPAYPALAAILRYGLRCRTEYALLLTAQAAAFGFWSYFFLFCERWKLSPALRFFGALAIAAHPAAFFLIAGYSESVFLMGLFGFLYWSGGEGRLAKILAALHGVVMSGTRIVGIGCAAFPLVQSAFAKGLGTTLRRPIFWLRQNLAVIGLTISATLGAVLFLLYCQVRWGNWDMYMLTQYSCWAIEPDYTAIFDPSNYHWLLPEWDYPTEVSQMAMTLGLLTLAAVLLCEMVPALRGRTGWRQRVGFYFCAGIIYYVSVSGVACVEMESMLRYEFPVHVLIVLAFLDYLRHYQSPPIFLRILGTVAVVSGIAAGLSLEGWYIWNFTRGSWVA